MNISSEGSLKTAIDTSNAGNQTTGVFTTTIVETMAPDAITSMNLLTLDGQQLTLRGDGTDAALIVSQGASVTLENLRINNTGAAAAISIAAQGVVTFANDGAGAGNYIGYITAPITGAGSIVVGGSAANPLYLTAANTYTGSTTVTGDLVVGLGGSIASSSQVTVGNAGILDISAAQDANGNNVFVGVNKLTSGGAGATVILGRNSLATSSTSTFAGVIENSANTSATFASGGGVTVQSGVLTLTGANTYTGSTRIFGSLILSGGGSIAGSENVSLKSATAVLDLTGNTAAAVTVNELTGVAGSMIHLGSSTNGVNLNVNENVISATYSGTLDGAGGLHVLGGSTQGTPNNTLTLAAANTYTGATTIDANGELALSGAGSIAASALTDNGVFDISGANHTVTVQALAGAVSNSQTPLAVILGANRLIDSGASSTFNAVIGGTGSLQVGLTSSSQVATDLTITNQQAYTGSTVIYGTLTLGGNTGDISDSSNVSLKTNGATFDVTNGLVSEAPSANGQVTDGVFINELTGVGGTHVTLGNNTLIINETTNASFTGVIAGAGGIEVDGTATLTLMGTNTYTGNTTIYGDLALGAGGSIVAASNVFDDGVFDISGSAAGTPVQIASLGSDIGQGSVVLGGNSLNVGGNGGTFSEFGGVISGAGGFGVNNGSEVALSGANTYSGTTTVAANSELYLFSDSSGSVGTINGSASINLVAASSELLVFTTETIAPQITGAGTVIVVGEDFNGESNNNATVTLTQNELYTGATIVEDQGTLMIGAGGSIASSSGVQLFDNSTFDISAAGGNVQLRSLQSNSAGDDIVLGANSIVITGPTNANNTVLGAISGTGGLQVSAGDTVTLEGQNTYTGSTVVTGTLDLTGNRVTMATSNISLKIGSVSNGRLDISGVTAQDSNGHNVFAMNELTGQTGTTVNLGTANGGVNLSINETTAASFSGVISGAGGFLVNGSAPLTLNAVQTYTGQTTIGGSLVIGSSGSIAASSRVVDNGFLTLGQNSTVNDLTGRGVLKMVTYTLTDHATNTSLTTPSVFSGAIHGAGVFDFEGSNTVNGQNNATATTTTTLVLNGQGSDYSGGTHLGGGTLEVGTMGAIGTGTVTFMDNTGAVNGGAANANNNAVLQIDNQALTGVGTATESFANHIIGMSANDIIDLSGLGFNSVPGASSVVTTTGHVTVTEGNVSVTLNIDDATSQNTYHVFQDSHGGTYLTMGGTTTTPDATHYHP